ncbi:protein kinase domain-containing protein [Actinomadura mexicana]|uniref:non-specific serine/threonine protein kinase n=1 Tax=Actinomadura mexicana TaxID=134959 RepID=A0A238WSD0_9ACTN|nr:protein kinase [Actinomadura mexicana]SNR49435.1 serine/threonine protein kinase [Actinomadura mexicana]
METGLRLTERYRLVERLDGGRTMEVWRAWDELLGRPVAVKVLTPASTGSQREFRRGVNRAAALSHAALETVFDSDQTRDASGRLASFVVTEFLVGETLTDRLRRGPLAAPEAAAVCAQIAGALEAAHSAGVTHGDLTPDKVVLVDGDAGAGAGVDVKVADTGIGGVVRAAAGGGTGGAATEAGDVRALGAVIAACLGPGAAGEPSALAVRCLGPDAPSAAEVAAALVRDEGPPSALFITSGRARPDDRRTSAPPPPPPPPGPARRGSARLAALALVVAIPVTAAAAVLLSAPRSPVALPAPARTGAAPPAPVPTLRTRPPAGAPRVTDALGRLRPIVSRGYAAGEIRSDVAIDLDNVITNLENDLTADRGVDVGGRIAELRDKIITRRRERGLSPGLAAELNRVLATAQA